MPTKTFEYTDFLEDWHKLEEKVGRDFRDYAGKCKDGFHPEIEYQDFWHFFIDCYDDQIRNDTYLYDINWGVVKNLAKTDWQKDTTYLVALMHNYWRCECGNQWECEPEDFRLGAVVQCENCKVVWAHIRARNGIKKWFPLDLEKSQSPFYNLLEPPSEEE